MKTRRNTIAGRVQVWLLILVIAAAMIPAMPAEAATARAKAIATYKRKLGGSTTFVLPRGKMVLNRNDDYVRYNYSKTSNVTFSIVYIDNDNIPELIVKDNYYGYGVWTYRDGRVVCVEWGDVYDEPRGYYKQTGMYVEKAYSEGTPYTVNYSQLKNGKMTVKLSQFVPNTVEYNEPDYIIGSSLTGTSVTRARFASLLRSYTGGAQFRKITMYKNTSTNRSRFIK